uniref:phosphatidylinositol 3,4,5-trisphosphate 3-phosphatase TPTE2-like isoform X2 n=1 Tax=Myodes glareolus TaxID=447135 RepID=UPI002020EF82|nr:phosphatidylinositol 3,4,5-trisphosphate 3-phosphatase TPTE2-like isoform X2 [Myodes glareolus]
MQGFKKSPLYLWLEHYGYNRTADAFTMYSMSSESSPSGNIKELPSASQSLKLDGNMCCDTNEESILTHNGSSGGSSYPDEVTSVNYLEPISDITCTDDSASAQILGGAVSDSTSLYEVNSSSELMKEILSQNESLTPHGDGTASELTVSSGLKSLYSTVSTSILIASSDLTAEIQEENINKCKLKQVSKLYDGDECIDIRKTYWNSIKEIVYFLVSSVAFRIFEIMLIFLDIFLVAIDLHLNKNRFYIPLEYSSVSFAIALFFLVDVLLRVYIEGRQHYFSDLLNTLDAVVIGVTLFIAITVMFYEKKFLRDVPILGIVFRPLRLFILIRILQLAHQKRDLEKLIRRRVSGNKRRYMKDGFDLDLTYVTERIIAMSFPSSGWQSFYRNPIKEVVRFLDTKHPDHYQVYNLCSERAYDPKHFHYRVRRIMIDDHNVPMLEEMLLFSKEVNDWLAQHPENVVAIHCKGGKGRTGTMVCACLIASEVVLKAKESLYFFGERRTDKTTSSKFQGIETPSQNRYVDYFEKLKISYQWTLPPRKILVIKRFIIYSIHGIGKGDGSDLEVQIVMCQETIFSCFSSKNCMMFHDVETDRVIINVFNCPALYDDVKVKFLSPAVSTKK